MTTFWHNINPDKFDPYIILPSQLQQHIFWELTYKLQPNPAYLGQNYFVFFAKKKLFVVETPKGPKWKHIGNIFCKLFLRSILSNTKKMGVLLRKKVPGTHLNTTRWTLLLAITSEPIMVDRNNLLQCHLPLFKHLRFGDFQRFQRNRITQSVI